MKKLFVLLLAVTVIMTTACGRLKESEQAVENCGSEDIAKIEEMYGAKTDNYKLVSGLQGKFKYVGSAQFGEVVFVADDNLYRMNSNGVSLISEHVNLNGNNFCYLNRNGEIVLVDQYDRNVSSYSEAGESFKIKLGKNQDRLICTDDLYYSFDDQKVVSSFNMFSDGSKRASTIINEVQRLPDGVSSDNFNIITAESATRGIVPFYLSEKNELLAIDMIDTNNGIVYIDEQFPAVCDVGEIYLWNASKNASPLFSKVGNVRSLFLVNYGRDVESAIDDASVEFVLPNDLTIYDIVDVIDCNGGAIILFDTNEVYFIKTLCHEFNMKSYLQKDETLTSLYQTGIISCVSPYFNQNAYYLCLITTDGGMYYYDVRKIMC